MQQQRRVVQLRLLLSRHWDVLSFLHAIQPERINIVLNPAKF